MQNALLSQLVKAYPSAAQCAAALGISRQAFSQSMNRGTLSNAAALRAAALLNLDPGQALLINATSEDITPPVTSAPPCGRSDSANNAPDNTNYAKSESIKKCGQIADNPRYVHSITSQEQKDAVDLIRWCYAVADMRADSPRFNYYVSRWAVPEKIAHAKANGTFDELTKNCPPIDPAWVRLVPAALEAFRQFIAEIQRPRETPASSSKSGKARNKARLAA